MKVSGNLSAFLQGFAGLAATGRIFFELPRDTNVSSHDEAWPSDSRATSINLVRMQKRPEIREFRRFFRFSAIEWGGGL